MGTIVQIVPIDLTKNVYLFIYGIDKNDNLVFKDSRLPGSTKLREKFEISEDGVVRVATFFFPTYYLLPFTNDKSELVKDEEL